MDASSLALIERHAREDTSREAVGILWEPPGEPEAVIPLTNRSQTPEKAYEVSPQEIVDALTLHTGQQFDELDLDALTVWHTHPSGLVGPSEGDMGSKIDGVKYMVVALTPRGPVATYF